MNKAERLLWWVFYFLIFAIIIKLIGSLFDMHLENQFQYIFLVLPVVLLILHSIISLGIYKGILFILIASTTGGFFENIGLKYGTFFGGHYIYKSQATLFDVPIFVILFWAVFIYMGYNLSNSFLYWLKIKKPQIKLNNFLLLPLLILIDGYFIVAIDFLMDPIAVRLGSWTWLNGGPYFGVPWGNFFGWFIVAIIASGIFRIFEYFFSKKEEKINRSIFIIPVIGYGTISISYILTALKFNLPNLAIIGSILMLPQVILSLFLFIKFAVKK